MATINPTNVYGVNGRSVVYVWEGMTENDTATAIAIPVYKERTVQVVGDLGGGTVDLQGSLNGTDFVTLDDADGNLLSFTTADAETIREVMRFYKPVLADGTSMDVDVYIMGAD